MPHSTLDELIAQLPERYQPIYGREDDSTSRAADSPRSSAIASTVDSVARLTDRPLRILDLGSAQGYYAFLLAERGHHVTGIDYLPINVAVSRAVHEGHPHLKVEFVEADLSDLGAVLSGGDFDVVLGLSVLHHIAFRDGHDAAMAMVQLLRDQVPHGIFEMALRTEPVYWADSLPADPRVTLAPYEFIREVAWSSTHLSDIERPLLFCSRTHALVNDELHAITRFAETSHPAAAEVLSGKRRYYDIDGGIVKIAAHFGAVVDREQLADIRDEMRHESIVIDQLQGVLPDLPTILEFHESSAEILIAKTTYPGRLVSELGPELSDAERGMIFEQVLEQLVQLEAHGWFHTDLRTWNVVWDASARRAWLIDHGAILQEPTDAAWPHDAAYSFVAFTIALWTGEHDQTGVDQPRGLSLDLDRVPPRIGELLVAKLSRPREPRFFEDVASTLAVGDTSAPAQTAPSLAVEWLSLVSAALDGSYAGRKDELDQLRDAYERLEAAHAEVLEGLAHISEQYDQALASRSALEAQYLELVASRSRLEAEYLRTLTAYTERDQQYGRVSDLYEAARVALQTATSDLVRARDDHERLLSERNAHALELAHELEQWRLRSADLDELVSAMSHTISWRLTRPLRGVRRLLRMATGR
ncbi:MAG: methyltransferase domain-containing protein [Ilumatobacteraceae bacterium]